jgi:DNA-binding NtrC family response regulator
MEAEDGQVALNLLEQYKFDVVVTDLALPKITGFGLVNEMRVKWPNTPVILVTAYLSPEAAKNILNEKVDFLPKPVDANELIAHVQRLSETQ